MTTTLEAIYENGIFKPVTSVPPTLREFERVRIIIETDFDEDLVDEIAQWEEASDQDVLRFEQALEGKSWMARGDVLLINLPAGDGREQSGRRPAIAVQTDISGEPMLMIAPITSNLNAQRFAFSVKIEPSEGNGLTETSIVMIFQMRAIDKSRIIKKIGKLSDDDLAQADAEIWKMLTPLE